MIPALNIDAWRENAPWQLPSQVEQDLIMSRALVEIFTVPLVKEALAFRGGTALHKLFVSPPSRYSEDIDLVQRLPGPIGSVLNAIRDVLDDWLGKPKWKAKEGRVILLYRFESQIPPVVPMKLKIEINTREHFSVFDLDEKLFSISNPWFSGDVELPVYQINELLGSKLRALYQRKKGRDLFDLYMVNKNQTLDYTCILKAFHTYMKHGGHTVSRAEFEQNLHEKLHDRGFQQDIIPLLAFDANWDQEAAANFVQNSLLSQLPGEPWKGLENKEAIDKE